VEHLDELKDQFQQSPDPHAGRAILARVNLRQLHALADLNHLDTCPGRSGLAAELKADRFGARQ